MRAHLVINYDPDLDEAWSVYNVVDDVVVASFVEFDDAVLRLRLLRGELALGDLT